MGLEKIISGGQTGVDQAALDAAMQLSIDCGGWCPPGRLSENGIIPDYYPLLETPHDKSDSAPGIPRSLRTEWNVRDSDATLILIPSDLISDSGSEWTYQCAANYNKPCIVLNPFDNEVIPLMIKWFEENNIGVLNIAGPSESKYPGIGSATYNILISVFKAILDST